MNTSIGNKNPHNFLKDVFTSFYPTLLFLNAITRETQLHCSLVLSPPSRLISSIFRFGESMQNQCCAKAMLCKSNVVQKQCCAEAMLCKNNVVQKQCCAKAMLCKSNVVQKQCCAKAMLCKSNVVQIF